MIQSQNLRSGTGFIVWEAIDGKAPEIVGAMINVEHAIIRVQEGGGPFTVAMNDGRIKITIEAGK